MFSIAAAMFYDEERFPTMTSEERKHCTSRETWMVNFNDEKLRKGKEFLDRQTAWNPAWKHHKKRGNKRRH
jgi:hypothetical protein